MSLEKKFLELERENFDDGYVLTGLEYGLLKVPKKCTCDWEIDSWLGTFYPFMLQRYKVFKAYTVYEVVDWVSHGEALSHEG